VVLPSHCITADEVSAWVDFVIVNGTIVWRDDRPVTTQFPGQLVKAPRSRRSGRSSGTARSGKAGHRPSIRAFGAKRSVPVWIVPKQ
jgi:hypothetical protein